MLQPLTGYREKEVGRTQSRSLTKLPFFISSALLIHAEPQTCESDSESNMDNKRIPALLGVSFPNLIIMPLFPHIYIILQKPMSPQYAILAKKVCESFDVI